MLKLNKSVEILEIKRSDISDRHSVMSMYVVHLKFTEKIIQRRFLFDTDSVGQWLNSEKDVREPFWAIEFIVLFCQDKFERPFSRPFLKFFDILF